MSAPASVNRLPVDVRGSRALGWWGMMLLIATEAALFAYLLFSYFYLASMARRGWPPGATYPSLHLAAPNTLILLASSVLMWWAESGIQRGRQMRLRFGLLGVLLLGTVFLVIQGIEYTEKMFTPRTDAYGSLFFTITGFHGMHVLLGLLMIAMLQARAWAGHFSAERHGPVTNVGWYWHFVDVVWLAVFTSLYLSPRFG